MTTGTVIFINGASSSGKTSLVKALQKALEQPFLDMGIDRFIFMLPERYLDRPLWDKVLGRAVCAGDVGQVLIPGMHHAIAAAARTGLNILADHVLVEKVWVDECAQLFAGLPAYLVGLYCPLEILEQREQQRRDRTLGQARAQFELIHRYTRYDLGLDTSRLNPEDCAQRILARLKSPPTAFKLLKAG